MRGREAGGSSPESFHLRAAHSSRVLLSTPGLNSIHPTPHDGSSIGSGIRFHPFALERSGSKAPGLAENPCNDRREYAVQAVLLSWRAIERANRLPARAEPHDDGRCEAVDRGGSRRMMLA